MTTAQHIAIVGAGLAGLSLARTLHLNNIPFKVYESELSSAARQQHGGTLDMHPESGQAALRTCGLYDEFEKIARPEGEATRILDRHSTIKYEDEGSKGPLSEGRPEVDRNALRDILLRSIPSDSIQWGHSLTSATRAADGSLVLNFVNGKAVTTHYVVGADGAWSHVRAAISPDIKPAFSGMTGVELTVVDAPARQPALARLVGQGIMCALDEGRGLISQTNAGGKLRTYALFRADEKWHESVDFNRASSVREVLLEKFDGFAESLTALITHCDDVPLLPRPIYALPIGYSWPHDKHVTLIGDAAHLMSPFAGEGANLAMLDGVELGQALAKGTDKALVNFERAMGKRASASARESAQNLEICFQPGSPDGFVAVMKSHWAPLLVLFSYFRRKFWIFW